MFSSNTTNSCLQCLRTLLKQAFTKAGAFSSPCNHNVNILSFLSSLTTLRSLIAATAGKYLLKYLVAIRTVQFVRTL